MKKLLVIFVGGFLFGWGLAVSGLAKPEVVLAFLHLDDLGLMLTMGAALALTAPIYQLAPRLAATPLLGGVFDRFPRRVTRDNLLGGALFGVGWGISGACPGAAVASIGLGNAPGLAAFGGMLLGAWLQGWVASRQTGSLERSLQES